MGLEEEAVYIFFKCNLLTMTPLEEEFPAQIQDEALSIAIQLILALSNSK